MQNKCFLSRIDELFSYVRPRNQASRYHGTLMRTMLAAVERDATSSGTMTAIWRLGYSFPICRT